MTEIVLQIIEPVDLALLARVAERFGIDIAAIKRFPRFGRSNSSLYRLQHRDHGSEVFVVKLGPLDDIRDEAERTQRSRFWILETASAVEMVEDPPAQRAALCVQYKADGEEVIELDDHYRDALCDKGDSQARLLAALDGSYGMLAERAHHPGDRSLQPTYQDLFARYQRAKILDRAEQLFESAAGRPIRVATAEVVENPLVHVAEVMPRQCAPLLAKYVHGDLHPSNVVLRSAIPSLVDFAWSNQNDHVCKDFVMMESAFRFMRFPRTLHPLILHDVDRMLNRNWSCAAAEEYVDRLPNSAGKLALSCAISAVARVRHRAGTVLKRFDVEPATWQAEYFVVLYLILAGQQKFDTFPLLRVISNLHDLAETYVH